MGLFQRQPINNEAPLYTLGGQETFLIIGLGNIGKEYEQTRHNLGFLSLDHFASKHEFGQWVAKKDLKSIETTGVLDGNRVILAKPTTMMNDSGVAVQALKQFYKIDDTHTLIIYDELAINFGKIRIRRGGSDAGNNGVKSVIQHGAEDTWRLRCGIGPKDPPQIDTIDYVLGKFSKEQSENLEKVLKGTQILISEFIHGKGKLEPETRSFIS